MKHAVWAALALLLITPDARAFSTLNTLGQHAEHEHITRAALSDFGPRTLDEIAGAGGSFGAVGAPYNPVRGLLFTSAAHCDNGDYLDFANYPQTQSEAQATLTSCRNWILRWLNAAVNASAPLADPGAINTSLGCAFNATPGRAKCTVLEDLGVALHASQDFYSHTNWVDRPTNAAIGPENPPGLGHNGRAPWLDPRQTSPFPRGLISVCFQSKPETLFCKYGDQGGARVRHLVLNKDDGPIGPNGATGPGTTMRGALNGNFQRAVAAAIDDTRDKWAYFQERVLATYGPANGRRILCVVRSDDRTRCP